jgi:hypothetical protein
MDWMVWVHFLAGMLARVYLPASWALVRRGHISASTGFLEKSNLKK